MKKMTQGATRLLVLALGLGLASTVWAGAKPIAVWNGDFGDATHGGVTLSLNGNSVSDGAISITDSSALGTTAGGGVRFTMPTTSNQGLQIGLVMGANLN